MKILFINPKSVDPEALGVPPLGILGIAAYIRSRGYKDIRVIDDSLEKLPARKLEDAIRDADIVGVTGSTCQYKYAQQISRICEANGVFSVMGGPHATPVPEDVLNTSSFDMVVRSEGEITFINILKQLNKKDFSKVLGISYRKDGKIIHNPDQPYIKDLDALPFPARDLVPLDKYPTKKLARFSDSRYTNLMTSRGCPNACTYCSSPITWRRTVRFRSASNVFLELKELREKFGFRCLHFHDDTFTVSRKRVVDLCDMIIADGLDIEWSCITRPDRCDYELCLLMAKAGCKQIDLGVESGSEKLLKMAGKNYTKKQIRKAFRDAKRAGLLRHAFFIIGLPGETLWTYLQSIKFARELDLDSSVWTVLLPFPGTEIYNKKLVNIIDADYVNWLYKTPVIRSGWMGPRTLMTLRKAADILTNSWHNPVYAKK